ncbi:MAG: hypothetical protein ACRENE_12630 [Polyangiaceae bacterium]
MDPTFGVITPILIDIEDPPWVLEDPTFDESFSPNATYEDPPIYLALRFAPGSDFLD